MKLTGTLSFITFSEIRKDIILLLLEGPRSLSEIRTALKISSSGVIPRLRDLEKISVIYRKDNYYLLTPTGKIIAADLKNLMQNLNVIEKNEQYWKNHSLDSIPECFHHRIGDIGDFSLIESTYENPTKPQTVLFKKLWESSSIKIITPVFQPEFPRIFLELTAINIPISIIITDMVVNVMLRDYPDLYSSLLKANNLHLYRFEDHLSFALDVTDKFLSLSLVHQDGSFDFSSNIISHDPSALKFGEDIFDHYLTNSKEIPKAVNEMADDRPQKECIYE